MLKCFVSLPLLSFFIFAIYHSLLEVNIRSSQDQLNLNEDSPGCQRCVNFIAAVQRFWCPVSTYIFLCFHCYFVHKRKRWGIITTKVNLWVVKTWDLVTQVRTQAQSWKKQICIYIYTGKSTISHIKSHQSHLDINTVVFLVALKIVHLIFLSEKLFKQQTYSSYLGQNTRFLLLWSCADAVGIYCWVNSLLF